MKIMKFLTYTLRCFMQFILVDQNCLISSGVRALVRSSNLRFGWAFFYVLNIAIALMVNSSRNDEGATNNLCLYPNNRTY